jgi:ATP-dependent Clp protease ATP-binding subunit ClpB
MARIVEIQVERLRALLTDRKITRDADRSALEWLAQESYDSTYGARRSKSVIQRNHQNPLAGMILERTIHDGETMYVSAGRDGLTINGRMAEAA